MANMLFGPSLTLSKNVDGVIRSGARRPGPTAPNGEVVGDLWYNTATLTLMVWNGTAWDPYGSLTIYNRSGATGSGSTGSATFVDVPGPIDLAFTKISAHTSLVIWGTMTHFKAQAGASLHALLINGVDYTIGDFFFTAVNEHTTIGFSNKVAAGLAPGNYTARLRWRTIGGGHTIHVDGNDVVGFNIQESL